MLTRTTLLIATLLLAGFLAGDVPPAEDGEVEATVQERSPEAPADVREALGIALSVPIEIDGIVSADLGILRTYLDMPDASEDDLNAQANLLALGAVQGLYDQIRQRDKLLVELNEQNKSLRQQLNGIETRRREEAALIKRLETRLHDIDGRLDRQSGPPNVLSGEQQNSQLSQRIGSMETDRRDVESQLRRMESRMDTTLSSLEGRTRELQSRLSRLESRMMSMPRN